MTFLERKHPEHVTRDGNCQGECEVAAHKPYDECENTGVDHRAVNGHVWLYITDIFFFTQMC